MCYTRMLSNCFDAFVMSVQLKPQDMVNMHEISSFLNASIVTAYLILLFNIIQNIASENVQQIM